MSRTRHHSQKHGTPAMMEGDKNRGCCYEYWTRRPFSNHHGADPGRDTKRRTHRMERLLFKRELQQDEDAAEIPPMDT